MYERPTLRRLGSFRDLTLVGVGQNLDGMTVVGDPNGRCDYNGIPGSQNCRS